MKEYQSLSHTRWDCKYHVVLVPKRGKKTVFEVLPKHPGRIFRELAQHKESEVVDGHLMSGAPLMLDFCDLASTRRALADHDPSITPTRVEFPIAA